MNFNQALLAEDVMTFACLLVNFASLCFLLPSAKLERLIAQYRNYLTGIFYVNVCIHVLNGKEVARLPRRRSLKSGLGCADEFLKKTLNSYQRLPVLCYSKPRQNTFYFTTTNTTVMYWLCLVIDTTLGASLNKFCNWVLNPTSKERVLPFLRLTLFEIGLNQQTSD